MERLPILAFEEMLERSKVSVLRGATGTVQINVGKLCNLACLHCHVEAGPKRTEMMNHSVVQRILTLLRRTPSVHTVDITGGSPEMNPFFPELVQASRELGLSVLDRLNPTIFFEAGFEQLPKFLATQEVVIIASLPCYLESNVDAQRGKGVFEKSIQALRLLNELGYGHANSGLKLHLVYNPLGASLPPDQKTLRVAYSKHLNDRYGIVFNDLYTITNMPIKRFLHVLERDGEYEQYMELLAMSFNPAAATKVMCRDLISIDWEGRLYDCDFNQMLELPAGYEARTVWDIESFDDLKNQSIVFGNHCYGCTAGPGSSCGGALTG